MRQSCTKQMDLCVFISQDINVLHGCRGNSSCVKFIFSMYVFSYEIFHKVKGHNTCWKSSIRELQHVYSGDFMQHQLGFNVQMLQVSYCFYKMVTLSFLHIMKHQHRKDKLREQINDNSVTNTVVCTDDVM